MDDPIKGKRSAEKERSKSPNAKRLHLNEDESPRLSENTDSDRSEESEEEFNVESDSEEADSIEDSSDIEDEEDDEGEDTSVLCGFQIFMRPNEDQAYNLFRFIKGKEYKMIAPTNDVEEARKVVEAILKDQCIPTFEANGVEVTRDNESEMIVYCKKLVPIEQKYKFSDKMSTSKDSVLPIHKNSVSVIRLEGCSEEFGTTDLYSIN